MLENPPQHGPDDELPRASLLARAGELCRTAIWMGGAHTGVGEPLMLEGLERAWVADLAGDMPALYRERAGRWFVRVFADIDAPPQGWEAIQGMVAAVAEGLRNGSAPEHLFVMCQHGMNRSGLVAGLVLRELGLEGGDAVRRIVAARPGALSNETFRRLLEHSAR